MNVHQVLLRGFVALRFLLFFRCLECGRGRGQFLCVLDIRRKRVHDLPQKYATQGVITAIIRVFDVA